MLGGRLDAAVQAPLARNSRGFAVSRAECSAGTDWRSACGNCGNFRTVPLSTPSLSWCHSTGGALAGERKLRKTNFMSRGVHPDLRTDDGHAYHNLHGPELPRVMRA